MTANMQCETLPVIARSRGPVQVLVVSMFETSVTESRRASVVLGLLGQQPCHIATIGVSDSPNVAT